MVQLDDSRAAARINEIAHILSTSQPKLLTTPPLQHKRPPTTHQSAITNAWNSYIQTPTMNLAQSLWLSSGGGNSASKQHLQPLDSRLLESSNGYMVCLGWDDCRCMLTVFRSLEYVDKRGVPTSVVDSFVSRLTAGEAMPTTKDNGGEEEDEMRASAWLLISNVFARTTTLRISAEAEEVSANDTSAVLTWFPNLSYLDIVGIPPPSLAFWAIWLPPRITCLKVKYAGIDIPSLLSCQDDSTWWSSLALLDLSNNPGIDMSSISKQSVSQQLQTVERMSVAYCELDSVPSALTALYRLSWLDLQGNSISDVSDISLRLGGISRLDLSHNQLGDVSGLGRMWALEHLDISFNQLAQWVDISPLRNLPALIHLHIQGNPFTSSATATAGDDYSYRSCIFAAFDHRGDISLAIDGRESNVSERREMAKIPRVAIRHTAANTFGKSETKNTPEISAVKSRRHKFAVIEEEKEDEDTSNQPSPIPTEYPPMLRATKLRSASLLSSPPSSTSPPPPPLPVQIKSSRGRRRKSRRSTFVEELQTVADTNTRPFSPVAASSTFSIRDPERYRKRVEMMRAEAGSSWLRAFTELQSTSQSPDNVSVSSQPPPPVTSSNETNGGTIEEQSVNDPETKGDTQLPSFLFPSRRRHLLKAQKNGSEEDTTTIPSLPHYSEDQPSPTQFKDIASTPPIQVDSVDVGQLADLAISTTPSKSTDTMLLFTNKEVDEREALRQRDDIVEIAEDVIAISYQLMTLEDTPLADDPDITKGSRVVRRHVEERTLSLAITTGGKLITAAGTGINNCIALDSIIRMESKETDGSWQFMVEVKENRMEPATWIEFTQGQSAESTSNELCRIVGLVRAAVQRNAESRLVENVYRQAECLRCDWRGCLDQEREVFEILLAQPHQTEYTLVSPPPSKELQCPQCKRCYVREFYATEQREQVEEADDVEREVVSAGGVWKRPFESRRNNRNSDPGTDTANVSEDQLAKLEDQKKKKELTERAQQALDSDLKSLGDIAGQGYLPFREAGNAVQLFLQLSVFEADGERLMQWVPAGLVRQIYPVNPEAIHSAATTNGGTNKWGLSSFLGGSGTTNTTGDKTMSSRQVSELLSFDPEHPPSHEDKLELAIKADWKTSVCLVPETCEQAVYLALSSHTMYVFTLTWEAISGLKDLKKETIELRPERYLGLLFSIPLMSLGRIDIGPNRQYLTLHSSLLVEDKKTLHWDARKLCCLLDTTQPAYPFAAVDGGKDNRHANELDQTTDQDTNGQENDSDKDGSHKTRLAQYNQRRNQFQCNNNGAGAVSTCVFMIRDRLACSDILDSLVEIGYETRAQAADSGTMGQGSGRLRALNHDIEWAMHHLVQQVFLSPSAFDPIDEDGDEGEKDISQMTVAEMGQQLVKQSTLDALQRLQQELLRTQSGRQPGAMVDASSGDNTIIDKVTYEFMKLYFCVGMATAAGIEPLTLVGSPHFLYLARERVDVWPPPVPDLREMYSKWQRIAPPTIVTSDPDTYDPVTVAEELARRSNASSSHNASSRATSAAFSSGSPAVTVAVAQSSENGELVAQLVSSSVNQYDRVVRARPIGDLKSIVSVSNSPVSVYPRKQKQKQQDLDVTDVVGCSGTGWQAMLRLEFATTTSGAEELTMTGWNVWFATLASAQECVEGLLGLTKQIGKLDVTYTQA